MGLSSFASKPVEDVAAANPRTFFQIYWLNSREEILRRAERARAAGAKGLIVTTDWSFSMGRDWGSPAIPEKVDVRALLKLAPESRCARGTRGRGSTKASRSSPTSRPPTSRPGPDRPDLLRRLRPVDADAPPSWEDLQWLREQWDGPFMVKGITRLDDAKRARDIGATALSVSNHGGNNLDGTPATIRMLGPIADTVGGDMQVLLDGGVRRGSDVVKALALGADAVMIGRA